MVKAAPGPASSRRRRDARSETLRPTAFRFLRASRLLLRRGFRGALSGAAFGWRCRPACAGAVGVWLPACGALPRVGWPCAGVGRARGCCGCCGAIGRAAFAARRRMRRAAVTGFERRRAVRAHHARPIERGRPRRGGNGRMAAVRLGRELRVAQRLVHVLCLHGRRRRVPLGSRSPLLRRSAARRRRPGRRCSSPG